MRMYLRTVSTECSVTWVICEGTWGLLIDNNLVKPCSAIVPDAKGAAAPPQNKPQIVQPKKPVDKVEVK
jgi:hypothetical protein